MQAKKVIPVILDTDIGTDIDDSWALAFLLASPELELKLCTLSSGNTRYRAQIAWRILHLAGRSEVPLALGRDDGKEYDYTLRSYLERHGELELEVLHDAAAAIVEMVNRSAEKVTVIAIGPLTNLADALKLDPAIAGKIDLVAMAGSWEYGHDHVKGKIAEYNIVKDVAAAQAVFAAPWNSFKLTPLDSCGQVRISRSDCDMLKGCSAVMREVVESNREWFHAWFDEEFPNNESSIMFDAVAVYLAWSTEYLQMQTLNLRCSEAGMLEASPEGAKVSVAVDWHNLDGFKKLFVKRLANSNCCCNKLSNCLIKNN